MQDRLISASGLASLWAYNRRLEVWRSLAVISLTLTMTSGLNAIALWVIRGDFDPTWWIPNLYLLDLSIFLFAATCASNARGCPT